VKVKKCVNKPQQILPTIIDMLLNCIIKGKTIPQQKQKHRFMPRSHELSNLHQVCFGYKQKHQKMLQRHRRCHCRTFRSNTSELDTSSFYSYLTSSVALVLEQTIGIRNTEESRGELRQHKKKKSEEWNYGDLTILALGR
jgi:hypothetical protein